LQPARLPLQVSGLVFLVIFCKKFFLGQIEQKTTKVRKVFSGEGFTEGNEGKEGLAE
jgi:ABC-type molybdate transport system permease subunit